MIDAKPGQFVAGGKPCLAAADDDGMDGMHLVTLPGFGREYRYVIDFPDSMPRKVARVCLSDLPGPT